MVPVTLDSIIKDIAVTGKSKTTMKKERNLLLEQTKYRNKSIKKKNIKEEINKVLDPIKEELFILLNKLSDKKHSIVIDSTYDAKKYRIHLTVKRSNR